MDAKYSDLAAGATLLAFNMVSEARRSAVPQRACPALELSRSTVLIPVETETVTMPVSQLKRAEQSIAAMRDQQELPPQALLAIEEIVTAIRAVDQRLAVLERIGAASTRQ